MSAARTSAARAAISSRLEQEAAHAAAGTEYARLTNLAPRTVRLPELEDIGASMMPESLDRAIEVSMGANPEIAALAAEVRAADMDRTAAKTRFLPRLDFEYTDNFSLHAGGDTNPAGQRDKRSMLVMNWNFFSGGGDLKYSDERTYRHAELRYRLDDQRRRIVQSLSAQYATVASTRERLTAGYKELRSITAAAEAMSKRMLSGNQSLLDLLDVYDRRYQARVRLVSLHIQEMAAVAQVVRLVRGLPGTPDPATKPADVPEPFKPAAALRPEPVAKQPAGASVGAEPLAPAQVPVAKAEPSATAKVPAADGLAPPPPSAPPSGPPPAPAAPIAQPPATPPATPAPQAAAEPPVAAPASVPASKPEPAPVSQNEATRDVEPTPASASAAETLRLAGATNLNTLARARHPDDLAARNEFRRAIAQANPGLFGGRSKVGAVHLPAGTVLVLPPEQAPAAPSTTAEAPAAAPDRN